MKKYLINSLVFVAIMGLFVVSGYDKNEYQSEAIETQKKLSLNLASTHSFLSK